MLNVYIQELRTEIAEQKPSLESLTAKCDVVQQTTADASMSSAVMQLATRYQALQTAAKVFRTFEKSYINYNYCDIILLATIDYYLVLFSQS